MNVLTIINIVLTSLLVICYAYQFIYIPISLKGRKRPPETSSFLSFAVIICARNEQSVIGRVIDSLQAQDYPKDKYRVFVAADNCTDETRSVAEAHGAVVYERFDSERVGKGYAMDYLIRRIRDEYPGEYGAYLVLDADNSVMENYLTQMNKTFALGYDCVTSYRGSANYADNWISAGQGMCFLRDMVLLNRARHVLGSSSFVSGTGYAFTDRLCDGFGGGWPFTTLTEDCEFTMYCTTEGVKMGFCDSARFLDEQPTGFLESWRQRLRWCRGGIQVFVKYIRKILEGLLHGRFFASFDMAMCMAPAYLISVSVALVNTVGSAVAIALGEDPVEIFVTLGLGLLAVYIAFLGFSIPLTVTEWRELGGSAFKKILYMLTFPAFMLTFVPITCVALFKRSGTWQHTKRKNETKK